MDLKDVVSSVYANAAEAHKAFHAGHHDTAENYLKSVKIQVEKYLDEKPPTSAEVAEQVTSAMGDETLTETQAKVSGPGVQPAVIDPVAAARSAGTGAAEQKQTR
ncbi:hypothetical protein ES703_43737 [subsurface metagenome]